MSASASGPGSTAAAGVQSGGARPATAAEVCPICRAPLQREQEWCVSCGAAARTRLAATPNWRIPVVALAVVIAVSLAVLAAALVKLAGT
jgi:hypothetical protein